MMRKRTGWSCWWRIIPKPEYWQNVLQDLYTTKMSDKQLLQLYRLSAEVGGLKTGSDYNEMAQLALDAGSPGEAVSTLSAGLCGQCVHGCAKRPATSTCSTPPRSRRTSDQPTLAQTQAEGANAATGDRLVAVGVGYFGYGDFPKAVKDISAGLAKGMSKDTTDARLLLGIAQLKSGDKDAAVQSLRAGQG